MTKLQSDLLVITYFTLFGGGSSSLSPYETNMGTHKKEWVCSIWDIEGNQISEIISLQSIMISHKLLCVSLLKTLK